MVMRCADNSCGMHSKLLLVISTASLCRHEDDTSVNRRKRMRQGLRTSPRSYKSGNCVAVPLLKPPSDSLSIIPVFLRKNVHQVFLFPSNNELVKREHHNRQCDQRPS